MDALQRHPARAARGDRIARRRNILDAGREVLERESYLHMGMREVAALAGVSPGTLYTYFPSREGLFAVLYAECLDRFTAEIERDCREAPTLRALLRAIADAYTPMYRIYARELSPWTARAGGGFHGEVADALMPSATRALATVASGVDRLTEGGMTPAAYSAMWAMLTGIADRVTGERARIVPIDWDELADTAVGVVAVGLEAMLEAP